MLATGTFATPTVRQFQRAVLVALGAIAVGGLIYAVETFVLSSRRRFAESPAEVMTRALGLAHFWIGGLFMLTSPRLRSWRSAGSLAFWTACGVGLCWLAYELGGARNPFCLMAFYGLFLIHEIRDEATLFLAYGDAPEAPARDGFLLRLVWSVTLSLMTLLATAYTLHGDIHQRLQRSVADPDQWLAGLVAGMWLACLTSWWTTSRFVRRHDLVWRDYAPLLVVYAGIGLMLAAGMIIGSVGFNLIVLIHVGAWLVFSCHRLALRRLPPGSGTWAWLRGTPAGLITLHAVAALVALTLMAVRVHVWERAGWLSVVFASSSFFYWTVLHILMTCWRGR